MFKIECLVEDKALAPTLKLLAAIKGVYELNQHPVDDVAPKKNGAAANGHAKPNGDAAPPAQLTKGRRALAHMHLKAGATFTSGRFGKAMKAVKLSDNPGTVYPALGALQQAGLIEKTGLGEWRKC
jgi:hypothetical protein